MKLSNTQLHKTKQSGGFLGRLLGSLLKTGLPLMTNWLKPLTKSILIPLGLTAAASVTDTAIHKKIFGSNTRRSEWAKWTTLIISNEEMKDIMKIAGSLKKSGLLIKWIIKTIKNETKEQKGGFLRML